MISDDESGVTVTVPASESGQTMSKTRGEEPPPRDSPSPASVVCVVEVTGQTGDNEEQSWQGSDCDLSSINEESSCVTISGNGVLTDHDMEATTASDEDEDTATDGLPLSSSANSSKLAKYFTFALESESTFGGSNRRKQPVVYRSERNRSFSPDPFFEGGADSSGGESSEPSRSEEISSAATTTAVDLSGEAELESSMEPTESIEDAESTYSESISSGDDNYEREEELRGYNRAIDFTLHTILEESCEESDGDGAAGAAGDPSELERYFTFGLGDGGGATVDAKNARRTSFANEESEYSDTFSETSSSVYSESVTDSLRNNSGVEDDDPVELASSRLEKYFLTNFLGIDANGTAAAAIAAGAYPYPAGRSGMSEAESGSESVGSDSEGHPSPEQQRRRKVMKSRGLRHQVSGIADWNARSDRGGSVKDASDAGSADDDGADASVDDCVSSSDAEEIIFEKTDGQFDTIKRRKKKRNVSTTDSEPPPERNSADPQYSKVAHVVAVTSPPPQVDAPPREESTPPVIVVDGLVSSPVVEQAGSADEVPLAALDPNCPRKYQSRDSGFVGSCDDLLNDSASPTKDPAVRKRLSSDSTSSNSDTPEPDSNKSNAAGAAQTQQTPASDPHQSEEGSGSVVKSDNSAAPANSGGGSGTLLSRKDSFNNWSSDEETNLMMNKMRAFFRNMISGGAVRKDVELEGAALPAAISTTITSANTIIPVAPAVVVSQSTPSAPEARVKPPQLVAFEEELTRLMKSVPGINDAQVKEIVEYLSSEDTWSDSYDSSDYTSSDLEGAYAVLDASGTLPDACGSSKSDLQQQISASCQEIIEKFDLDRSPEGSRVRLDAPSWRIAASSAAASASAECGSVGDKDSLNKETAFVYQKLINSLMRHNSASGGNQNADSTEQGGATATAAGGSPPVIARVLQHIGNRLVALMHEVSASSDTTSHSGSLDEDTQGLVGGRSGNAATIASASGRFEAVTSSPRLAKMGRMFKEHSSEDKSSAAESAEETPTDTERSPDQSDSDSRIRKADGGIKYGFESLHTYEKRMSSLPSHAVTTSTDASWRAFLSLDVAPQQQTPAIGGSRSLKARLAERARTVDAERRRAAEEKRMLAEEDVTEEDAAEEDRFYKKERKLPRFSLFRNSRDSSGSVASSNYSTGSSGSRSEACVQLASSSSGVSDIAEEKEDDFCGWRSSFESAIAADSRTKLSLEAKRRSAGSASSSELFASSVELLDRDSGARLRHVRASGHSSKFSLPNLLERDAVRIAKERERERSASSDVLLSTSPGAGCSAMLLQQDTGPEGQDQAWDRLVITRLSSKRRSSVPDTREERGVGVVDEPRSTTLPRSTTALNAVLDNDLDHLGSGSPTISASTAGVKKSLSLLLGSGVTNSASESSLNTSVDTPIKSVRYRSPGFKPSEASPAQRSSVSQKITPVVSASLHRITGSQSASLRRNVKSMFAGTIFYNNSFCNLRLRLRM